MSSVDQIISNLRAIDTHSLVSDDDRLLLKELRGTLRRIQSPWDVAWDQAWVHGNTMAAIKTLIDASVFVRWAEAGNKPMTTSEIAYLTGADPLLLSELMFYFHFSHLLVAAPGMSHIFVGLAGMCATVLPPSYDILGVTCSSIIL